MYPNDNGGFVDAYGFEVSASVVSYHEGSPYEVYHLGNHSQQQQQQMMMMAASDAPDAGNAGNSGVGASVDADADADPSGSTAGPGRISSQLLALVHRAVRREP